MASEPEIITHNRDQLTYLLTEAAEIEHGLMCCYLYAAYSLRRGAGAELAADEAAAVERWRITIVGVALEMLHLALANNLLVAIGSPPHFQRPNFPVAPGYHPAGVVVSLAPFDRATLDHFIYLERPEGPSRVRVTRSRSRPDPTIRGQSLGSARPIEYTVGWVDRGHGSPIRTSRHRHHRRAGGGVAIESRDLSLPALRCSAR